MPHEGVLGGTYGGNPVACRAGLAVLEILTSELIEKAHLLGAKARQRSLELQREFEIIGELRGLGPMLGIELVKDQKKKTPAPDEAKAIVKYCYENGLIAISCGNFSNVIRTLMPLVITEEQMDRGFSILREALKSIQ
jgi:4-aminobutyrate aminotransferase/(S)-3-amino-2-methylpropionate transaminase